MNTGIQVWGGCYNKGGAHRLAGCIQILEAAATQEPYGCKGERYQLPRIIREDSIPWVLVGMSIKGGLSWITTDKGILEGKKGMDKETGGYEKWWGRVSASQGTWGDFCVTENAGWGEDVHENQAEAFGTGLIVKLLNVTLRSLGSSQRGNESRQKIPSLMWCASYGFPSRRC